MQHHILKIAFLIGLCVSSNLSYAQTDWGRLFSGTIKAGQAMTITDEELAQIVHEQVEAMDKANNVCGPDSKYSQRLKRLTKEMTDADGIKLNFTDRTHEIESY
jgi:putative metalloprotease